MFPEVKSIIRFLTWEWGMGNTNRNPWQKSEVRSHTKSAFVFLVIKDEVSIMTLQDTKLELSHCCYSAHPIDQLTLSLAQQYQVQGVYYNKLYNVGI